MDAIYGDDSAGLAVELSERHSELLLDALKAAIEAGGEQRLFRSGKLKGLFPYKSGTCAETALHAIQHGFLEKSRSETKGKIVTEWVKATPRAIAFVHEQDSPKSVLKELKGVLDTTRAGVPNWMAEARSELALLSRRFEEKANGVLSRLNELAGRVESALRRAEAKAPSVAEPVARVVPWALDALEYLDQRETGGALSDCPLPELFHAVRVRFPDLPLGAFHDGLCRLHDVRAVRLSESEMISEPEYAVVIDGRLMYAAGR
jgi:hypothetical protein